MSNMKKMFWSLDLFTSTINVKIIIVSKYIMKLFRCKELMRVVRYYLPQRPGIKFSAESQQK